MEQVGLLVERAEAQITSYLLEAGFEEYGQQPDKDGFRTCQLEAAAVELRFCLARQTAGANQRQNQKEIKQQKSKFLVRILNILAPHFEVRVKESETDIWLKVGFKQNPVRPLEPGERWKVEPVIVQVSFVKIEQPDGWSNSISTLTCAEAQFDNGRKQGVFQYYPDELYFEAAELVGLTEEAAKYLKRTKDVAYLQLRYIN